MKNLEEALKENAKGILASTMRQEINSLVKESLTEQDEVGTSDEEEVDVKTPEGEEDVDDETFSVDDEDDLADDDDFADDDDDLADDDDFADDDDDLMANLGTDDDEEEVTVDMRGASDDEVATVFAKMDKNDKVSIEKVGDFYELRDTENDTEYIIKLNESDEFYENAFDSQDRFMKRHMAGDDSWQDEDLHSYRNYDSEGDLGDIMADDGYGRKRHRHHDEDEMDHSTIYELELEEEGDYGLGEEMYEDSMTYEGMGGMHSDELDEEMYEDSMTYEGMGGMHSDELDEEMYEDMTYDELDEMYTDELDEEMYEDMTYEDLDEDMYGESWSSMANETDKFKVHESKQKTGSASKFKYSKKPNQEGGFNTKMKEGSKRFGKSGKASFDYDNEDPNSEIVMKIVNKIKGGKKSETKEASRTLGVGRAFGKKGLDKKITAPRHLKEEVEILREKNEEYKKALDLFRTKLNEVAVFNSNLAYATRLFTEHSTTKQEKINILRRFDNVESLKESKNLYQTLKSELSNNNLTDNSINESINRTVMKAPSTGSAVNLIESKTYENPQFMRMKDLMGKIK